MSSRGLLLRVIWKEYRQQRAFWLVLAVCGMLIQAALVWNGLLAGRPPPFAALLIMAAVFPCLFALGCGTMCFAGEHDADTFGTLQALPVSARQVFVGKFASSSVGLLALPLVLCLSAMVSAAVLAPDQLQLVSWNANSVMRGLVTSFELLALGMFFSLQLRRPLWALVAAAVTAMLYIVALPLVLTLFDRAAAAEFLWALPLHCLIAVVLVAIDYWLALGWLAERPRTLRDLFRDQTTAVRDPSRVEQYALIRLVWHEWRQGRALRLGALAILAIHAVPTLLLLSHIPQGDDLSHGLLVFAALMGGCAFLSDQSQGGYRFFAERGIDARRVWLSRQLMWGGFALVVCSAVVWVTSLAFPIRLTSGGGSPAAFSITLGQGLGLALVAYTAAQVGSIYSRSGVIGLFLGLFLAAAACTWCVLMHVARVPLIWSAAPLPVWFLWITWLRAPDWVTEQTSRRATTQSVLSLASPLVLVAAVISYRVHEIPAVTLPSLDEVLRPATDEERVTAGLYLEAMNLLLDSNQAGQLEAMLPAPSPTDIASPDSTSTTVPAASEAAGQATADASNSDRLRQSAVFPDHPAGQAMKNASNTGQPSGNPQARAATIAKFFEASRRPACRFRYPPSDDLSHFTQLVEAVLADGDPKDDIPGDGGTLERCFAVLRFARHLYQSKTTFHHYVADSTEARSFDQLVKWCARDDRAPGEIRQVIERLERECFAFTPPRDQAVLHNYLELKQFAENIVMDHPLILRFMPWERVRWQRLLAYYTVSELGNLRLAESDLRNRVPSSARSTASDQLQHLIESSLPFPPDSGITSLLMFQGATASKFLVDHETQRRAARIRLEVLYYRAERGVFPARLEQLIGQGEGDPIPPDPYTGSLFIYDSDESKLGVRSRVATYFQIPTATPARVSPRP